MTSGLGKRLVVGGLLAAKHGRVKDPIRQTMPVLKGQNGRVGGNGTEDETTR